MRYTIEQWNDCYIVTDTHTNESWPCGGLDTVLEMVGEEYDELIKSLPSNHAEVHQIAVTIKRTNRKQIKIRWNGRFYFAYKFPAYVSNDPMAPYEQWNYEA